MTIATGFAGILSWGALILCVQEPSVPRSREARVEVTLDYWRPSLHGRASVDETHTAASLGWFFTLNPEYLQTVTDLKGTNLSFQNDLGMDDPENVFGISLSIVGEGSEDDGDGAFLPGRTKVSMSYWAHTWREAEIQDGFEAFSGSPFAGGDTLKSEFQLHLGSIDGTVEWDRRPDRQFTLGGSLGLDFFYSRLNLEGTHGTTASDVTAGLLVALGLHASVRPASGVHLTGSLSGSGGFGPAIAEAEVRGGATWGPAEFELGYRYITIKDSGEHESLYATLQGPLLSVSIRF